MVGNWPQLLTHAPNLIGANVQFVSLSTRSSHTHTYTHTHTHIPSSSSSSPARLVATTQRRRRRRRHNAIAVPTPTPPYITTTYQQASPTNTAQQITSRRRLHRTRRRPRNIRRHSPINFTEDPLTNQLSTRSRFVQSTAS